MSQGRMCAHDAIEAMGEAGKTIVLDVQGKSMLPMIRRGDRVTVRPVGADRINAGDLFVFRENEGLIVHRCIGKRDSNGSVHLRQKGDNLRGWSWVPAASVVGRVESVLQGGRSVDLTSEPWLRLNGAIGDVLAKFTGSVEKRLRGPFRNPGEYSVPEDFAERAVRRLCGVAVKVLRTGTARREGDFDARGASSTWSCALPKELELLVLAARVELGDDDGRRMDDLLRSELNWREVLTHSARFGIGPLLYRHLSHPCRRPLVPGDAFNALSKAYGLQILKDMRLKGRLKLVLDLAQHAHIPVISLKGSFLATWIYPDSTLRLMSDIDLLCRRGEGTALLDLLKRKGIGRQPSHKGGSESNSPLHREVFMECGDHLPVLYDSKISRIEVHERIFKDPEAGGTKWVDEPWAKRLTHDWDGLPVCSLSPEHQLLHLVTHLHRHVVTCTGITLYWFCDIHEVVKHYGDTIDWKTLESMAEELGEGPALRSILSLMREHWNTPCPDLSGRCRRIRLGEILLPSLDSGYGKQGVLKRYYRNLKRAGHVQDWKNRLLYLWGLVFPSPDNMRYRYHPKNRLMLCAWYGAHPFIKVGRGLESLYHCVHFSLSGLFRDRLGKGRGRHVSH
ncbi:MAG: nucleotidyltransferase family protein [Acidobacteriota bacterium]